MARRIPDHRTMSDDHESLVARASQGDTPAIDELLARHMPALLAYVRLKTGDAIRARESVSDLAQSVCREVVEGMDRFEYRGEPEFKHWLFAKALNKIRDRVRFWRAQRREAAREVARLDDAEARSCADVYASLVTPSRVAGAREELAAVERVFDKLSEQHREVIVLARVVGLSHAQIAERLGCSEVAARKALHRALVKLSHLLHRQQD